MDWFVKLLSDPASIAHIVVLYAAVISIGVKLGKVKFGGIALGVTFVLFAGIVAGHVFNMFGIDHVAQKPIIDFVKELGLILFVYCIGLQVGPSFFATFKQGGLGMNLLTVGLVLLNVVVMLCLYFLCKGLGLLDDADGTALPMMVGVMYGAVTNTPGLGAANGVLPTLFPDGAAPAIANGYACAYPLGVVGIILSTIAIRYLCRISLEKEQEQIRHEQESHPHATPKHLVIRVTNSAVIGRTLQDLHTFLNREFVVSRILYNGELIIPNGKTRLEKGMEVHLVCAEDEAEPITVLMGEALPKDWTADYDKSKYVSHRLVITKPEINGKTFGQLHFSTIYGVNVTRVTRNGMELFANRNLRLQVGDRILVTGPEENIEHVKDVIGSSVKRLDHPNVGAIFFGILLGIIVGQIPIPIPGVDIPVKLGLAGGPLVVAILIGAFGYRYKINTYTSTSANLMLREVGLILFLASVGIQAGATFWNTVTNGDGLTYVWTGFLITTLPILVIGLIGRLKLKLNYFTLMGLIAGSNTDPPALAFANQTAGNDAPAVGYSTVYPLAMFLRILVAQLVLLFFCSPLA